MNPSRGPNSNDDSESQVEDDKDEQQLPLRISYKNKRRLESNNMDGIK
jgi:hypothetical protein